MQINLAYFKKKQYLCRMKRTIIQILVWLGVLFACSVVAVILAVIFLSDSAEGAEEIARLKWMQLLSAIGTFLVPPIICAYLWDEHHRPERWLQMDRGAHWSLFLMAIGIMVVALPAVTLFEHLNHMIPMPQSAIDAEESAKEMMQGFLQMDTFGDVLVNLGLIAVLPALCEEMTFRGTLQQILRGEEVDDSSRKTHIAIWATAIIFSAIHMQFLGFIPRMMMGALFGYMFVWSGSLWIPIAMHFTNNAIGVFLYDSNADTMGADVTWCLGVISLVITSLGLLIFYRRTHTR